MADTTTQWQDVRETRDVPRRGMLLFAGGFVLFLLLASAGLWLIYGRHVGGFAAAQHLGQVPNDAELNQRDQLAAYQAAQQAELSRLAWTDDSKQFAKIPIDDAMRLLAARGAAR
jgi:hypothetical protein